MTRQAGRRQASKRSMARRLVPGGIAVMVAALVIPPLPAVAAAAVSRGGSEAGVPAATASGGTLRAWGFNVAGQLGDGTAGGSSGTPVKVKLPAGTRITSVRAGCDHTLALTSNGRVLAWGLNGDGQLGDGTSNSSNTPIKVKLPAGTRVTAVRAGCVYSLALTSTGQVLAWGANNSGQLGDGTNNSSNTPVPVTLPPGTKVKAISAGDVHNLALTTAGQVLAWGSNEFGQLGDGTATERDTPVPVNLPPGVKVTAIAAGGLHSLARTSNRKVLAWGENGSGQLGDGTNNSSDAPVTVKLPAGTRVRGLVAGCLHTLALTTTGKVLAWGLNGDGELGDGSTTISSDAPVRVKLPKGTKVTAIGAGCHHSLARTASGHVLAWGINRDGELGNGSTAASSNIPVRVKLPAGLAAIAIGAGPAAEHSLAIVHKANS